MERHQIQEVLPGQIHVTGPGALNPETFARWYRDQTLRQWEALDVEAIGRLAVAVESCAAAGRTIYVMGNGGSAATAAHIATDLSKTAAVPGKPSARCVSLSDNVAYITAIGNDLSFDDIFSRQLENLVAPGDLVLLISGSGNSPNLLKAAELAHARKATTAAFLGFNGGRLKAMADIVVHVQSDQYGVIEDVHLSVGHMLTFYLRQRA